MRRTVFNTPVVSDLLWGIAIVWLKVTGWRKAAPFPHMPKYIIVGAHHTSSWDLPFALVFAFVFGIKIHWMGKDALFRWPFGPVMRWLGGIPIDRSKANGVVEQSIQAFRDNDELVIVITPEGTRKRVDHWKSGFYHIAKGAHVPIVVGFLDYGRKVGGAGPVITPTGDIEADMKILQDFFATVSAKHPDQAGEVRIAPRT